MGTYCPMCDEQKELGTGQHACPDCGMVFQNTEDSGSPKPKATPDQDSDPDPKSDESETDGSSNQPVENKCPNCGEEVSDDFSVCPYCSTSLSEAGDVTPEGICPDCGYDELQSGMQVCPMCAEPLSVAGEESVGDDAGEIDQDHPARPVNQSGNSGVDSNGEAPPASIQLRFEAGPVMSVGDGADLGVEIRKKLHNAGVARSEAMRVSRTHVRFERDAEAFHVVDLESANGTQLNGDRLEPNRKYELSDGDTLDIAGVAEANVRF